MKYIGYCRVSTTEQGLSGLGLEAQKHTITQAAMFAPWTITEYVAEVGSGAKTENRPELQRVLAACKSREADGIVVSKLDRLGRSAIAHHELISRAQKEGWNIVALDLGVDLSTPNGRLVAGIFAQMAEWERDQISVRTKEGLAAARARGTRLGAAPRIDAVLAARIRDMRGSMTLWGICDTLNGEGVPTPAGGLVWRPSSLERVLS